jgi:short-subunit dehydrogenase
VSKLVFITGASSGLGQALALRFYRAGYSLALVARRVNDLQSWVNAHGISVDRYRIYSADVSISDNIIAAGQACLRDLGIPDVVIANAGISIGMDSAIQSDLDVMTRTLTTNLVGMAATFHPFLTAMTDRGAGRLVGIGSVAGIRGLPGHGAYCASKAGVISYCESLRGELRPSGVKVITICPGYIDTPLTQKNTYGMPFLMSPEAFSDRALKTIERGASYQVIPWQMGVVAKLLRVLPNALLDKALAGRARKARSKEG